MWDDALQLIAEHPAYAPQVYLTLTLTKKTYSPYRRSPHPNPDPTRRRST